MNKKEVYELCNQLVTDKLSRLDSAIANAQRAANEETKSSAGDKYETGRAMMHLEQEKLISQRVAAQRLLQVLHQIDSNRTCSRIGLGSLVKTNHGSYYLAVGLGPINVGSDYCFVISPMAPLGQVLRDKQVGDVVEVNGKTFCVERLE